VALALGWLAAGCLPFARDKPRRQHPSATTQRLADEANALGVPPSPPALSEVTHTMARAVESLPKVPDAHAAGQKIEDEARAMEREGDAGLVEHARRSAAVALGAVEQMKNPAGDKNERERVLGEAHSAVDRLSATPPPATQQIADVYRAVSAALLTATGGHAVAAGRDLQSLLARFATADAEEAVRSAPQVLYAMSAALESLSGGSGKVTRLAGELRRRAERLAGADTLEQSTQLKDALGVAVDALDAVERTRRDVDLQSLRKEARAAVARIISERPLELQRGAVQDAFRIVADGIALAGPAAAQLKRPLTTR